MTTRKIDKSDWATYFDHVSRTLRGECVTIEVTDAEGSKQLMGLSEPLMLPMPVGTEAEAG